MKSSKKALKLPVEMIEKGAEANIYQGYWMDEKVIMKKRIQKNYRIKEIDSYLRKIRTKGEVKLLSEAKSCGVKTPTIYDINKHENAIIMGIVKGTPLKKIFQDLKKSTNSDSSIENLCEKIGKNIAKLHNCNIIHGDLTSSNMILQNDDIFFIDFGLGKISSLVEDKGVDLLVFKKAISGIHNNISNICFTSILKGYQDAYDYTDVVAKLMEIEGRGRYLDN
jgi:N6-L-threonylcarbamoyladenine synthase/protein kinase Bud32